MVNLRRYGEPPYTIAVIHGGPGAAGEMSPVAHRLSSQFGVLEPLQTAITVTGQIEELSNTLRSAGSIPIQLIGYSWGAWLSIFVAAQYPELVSKLILVSSGAFETKYVAALHSNRMNRLTSAERREFEELLTVLHSTAPNPNTDEKLSRLGELSEKTDSYDLLDVKSEAEDLEINGALFQSVWNEAAAMRSDGRLLTAVQLLQCPVVAIHGDYDPTPFEGVEQPLRRILNNFEFILLGKCGHTPWREKQAAEHFYQLLLKHLILT